MRRIAAVALAAGTLTAGIGAVAAPANAAPAEKVYAAASGATATAGSEVSVAARGWNTHKRKKFNAYKNVQGWGTASRTSTGLQFRGKLKDGGRDGWTSCVRFKATQAGKKAQFGRIVIVGFRNGNRFFADQKVTVKFGPYKLSNKGALFVQECRRSKSTGKFQFANKKWQRVL